MDGLEVVINDLRKELVEQGKTLVAQGTLLKVMSDTLATAGTERGKIASELGAYGIALTKFVASTDALNTSIAKLESIPGRVANLEADFAEVRPKVDTLMTRYQQAMGAGWLARILWLVGGGIVVWLATHVPWFQQFQQLPRK